MTPARRTKTPPPIEQNGQRATPERGRLRLAMPPLHNTHREQVEGRNWTVHGWASAGAGALIGFAFAVVSILTNLWCHAVPAPTLSGFDTACPQNTGLAVGLLLATLTGAAATPALWLGAVRLLDTLAAHANRHH